MMLPPWVRENVPLAGLTTFGIGGPARWLAEPATRGELAETLALARKLTVPFRMLGGGSNLLVSDTGISALVIRLSHSGEFGKMDVDPSQPLHWRVGAAVGLQELVGAAGRRGAAGLEALAGIPGTAGGAAAMNAGGAGFDIGHFIAAVEVFRLDGESRVMVPPELFFAYRKSALAGMAAVELHFRFSAEAEPEKLLARMRDCRERKRMRQPLNIPSAGCIFRNPPGHSAGMLLDQAECKGMREGGAEVSSSHANFIINRGNASAYDVAVLAKRMREAVLSDSGVELKPEIVLWGDDPAFTELTGAQNDHQ
ncbi:MAG: UDP-N-acetylmuramate dehydrogenase [Planctomycetes bacterium]|nr:UDP-N-acetylmuramate dehydrogenase [Planctomycetota bacterium]